jgi:hypothetical protein
VPVLDARRRSTLLVLAVVVVAVGALAAVDRWAGGGGGDGSVETPATTTTLGSDPPATTRGFASTVTLPKGLRLLAWLATGWGEIIDPATGTVGAQRVGSGAEFVQMVPRLGGVVVYNAGQGTARWYPEVPYASEPAVVARNVVRLLPSDIPERVWVVHSSPRVSFREIDLTTGASTETVLLPFGARVPGAVDGGVVVSAPDGLYRHGRDGSITLLAHGEFVAAGGRRLAYRACDAALRCGLHVVDVDTARTESHLELLETQGAAFSPDGRWLAVADADPVGMDRIVVIDLADGRSQVVAHQPDIATSVGIPLTWTPDSRWLLWPDRPGVAAYAPDGGEAAAVDLGDPAYQGVVVLESEEG